MNLQHYHRERMLRAWGRRLEKLRAKHEVWEWLGVGARCADVGTQAAPGRAGAA